MIEIKCVDEQTAQSVCQQLQLPCGDVFEMTDRDTVLGTAVATRDGEETCLLYMDAPDAPLTDALLRAVLNAERATGAKTAKIMSLSLYEHMIKKKYAVDSTLKTVNIADFFAKSACKD